MCWGRHQRCHFPGSGWSLSLFIPLASGPWKSGSRDKGLELEVTELNSHGQ